MFAVHWRTHCVRTDGGQAHGTGTPVGDPIEVEAISRAFGRERINDDGHQLRIGSVKTNVGHSEAVSGITSVIKSTLALEKGLIPPTIGIKNLNPNLKLEERRMRIVTSTERFKRDIPRIGVNSFGYGGANAHVLLESASPYRQTQDKIQSYSAQTCLLAVSAHNEESLRLRIEDLRNFNPCNVELRDLSYTLARRSRFAVSGSIITTKDSYTQDMVVEKLIRGNGDHITDKWPIAFVFTGQGAQWPAMGRELLLEYPVFLKTIRALDETLSRLPHAPSWSLEDAIMADDENSKVYGASQSQPVCTALQLGLVELLRAWEVEPDIVVGHSSGEIAAAVAAGHISAKEGIIIAYYRGYVVSRAQAEGAMMVVGLSAKDFQERLEEMSDFVRERVDIACINSPESITVSGDDSAVNECLQALKAQDVFVRTLKTDNKAYHSSHMRAVGEQYEHLLRKAGIGQQPPMQQSHTVMCSSLTSEIVTAEDTARAQYWRSNLESPVLFQGAMEKLFALGKYHVVELGPHSALKLPIKQISAQKEGGGSDYRYWFAMSRGQNSVKTILRLMGSLYCHGHDIPFSKINYGGQNPDDAPAPMFLTDVPRYRWAYPKPLWHEPRASSDFRKRKFLRHDLLGSLVPGGSEVSMTWRNMLKLQHVPFLEDHRLGDQIIFPAAGYLAMAIEALAQLQMGDVTGLISLTQVHLVNALELSPNDGVELFTQLSAKALTGRLASTFEWDFVISSHKGGKPTVHVRGSIGLSACFEGDKNSFRHDIAMRQQSVRSWYETFAKEGVVFGPHFESLIEIRHSTVQLLPQTKSVTKFRHGGLPTNESTYVIHPITIDALLQTGGMTAACGSISSYRGNIPNSIEMIQLDTTCGSREGTLCTINAVAENRSMGSSTVYGELLDQNSVPLLRMSGLRFVPLMGYKPLTTGSHNHPRQPMLRVCWKPDISKPTFGQTQWENYRDMFVSAMQYQFPNAEIASVAAGLDLVTHKYGSSRVLQLGVPDKPTALSMLQLLGANDLRRFASYQCAQIAESRLLGRDILSIADLDVEEPTYSEIASEEDFDVIVLTQVSSSDSFCFLYVD